MEQRTTSQNKALHRWFSELATELNNRGLDMRTVLKPTVEIPWDEKMVKEHLWRPIQKVMLGKQSTTELTTADVNKVYEVIDRHLLKTHDIDLAFPSAESLDFLIKNDTYEENAI